jgi:hypothetical protein
VLLLVLDYQAGTLLVECAMAFENAEQIQEEAVALRTEVVNLEFVHQVLVSTTSKVLGGGGYASSKSANGFL